MKLPYQQLTQHLAKSLAPIYLVSGDELLLVQETVDFIRAAAQKAGFSERTRIPVEAGSDWAKLLYANAHSMSLFAEQRILELDLRGVKLNQANSEILTNYAENPAEQTLLIIQTGKLDQKTEQTRWYKSIDKKGIAIPIWPVTTEQLPQWIIQRAKKANLTLTNQAAGWLAERVEGNLFAAAQEIEKLALLQPNGIVDEDILEKQVMNHARFDIFNLVDSFLLGNSKRSLLILNNLFDEDTEPTLIMWAITRELRSMAELLKQVKQGAALSSLFSQFRIWEKRQPPVRAFLKRATPSQCWDWLLHAAKIDRIIKGAEIGKVQDELERLILSLTGNAII